MLYNNNFGHNYLHSVVGTFLQYSKETLFQKPELSGKVKAQGHTVLPGRDRRGRKKKGKSYEEKERKELGLKMEKERKKEKEISRKEFENKKKEKREKDKRHNFELKASPRENICKSKTSPNAKLENEAEHTSSTTSPHTPTPATSPNSLSPFQTPPTSPVSSPPPTPPSVTSLSDVINEGGTGQKVQQPKFENIGQLLMKNQPSDTEIAFDFLSSHLLGSLSEIPSEIKFVTSIVSKFVEEKFGSDARKDFVAGYFFLRFLCPALAVPHMSLQIELPFELQKLCLLMSKVIQVYI
jgi:hypothetical protein